MQSVPTTWCVLLQYECENVLNDAALMEACGVGLSRNDMYGVMMVCKQLGEDPKLAVATVRFFGKVHAQRCCLLSGTQTGRCITLQHPFALSWYHALQNLSTDDDC